LTAAFTESRDKFRTHTMWVNIRKLLHDASKSA
jgi:hypothetical protein